jgi:hypothetical protein
MSDDNRFIEAGDIEDIDNLYIEEQQQSRGNAMPSNTHTSVIVLLLPFIALGSQALVDIAYFQAEVLDIVGSDMLTQLLSISFFIIGAFAAAVILAAAVLGVTSLAAGFMQSSETKLTIGAGTVVLLLSSVAVAYFVLSSIHLYVAFVLSFFALIYGMVVVVSTLQIIPAVFMQ